MWYFCFKEEWISKEEYEQGDSNSGFEMSQETTERLAQKIEETLKLPNIEEIIKSSSDEYTQMSQQNMEGLLLQMFGGGNQRAEYEFEKDDLEKFGDFCASVETFKIC